MRTETYYTTITDRENTKQIVQTIKDKYGKYFYIRLRGRNPIRDFFTRGKDYVPLRLSSRVDVYIYSKVPMLYNNWRDMSRTDISKTWKERLQ